IMRLPRSIFFVVAALTLQRLAWLIRDLQASGKCGRSGSELDRLYHPGVQASTPQSPARYDLSLHILFQVTRAHGKRVLAWHSDPSSGTAPLQRSPGERTEFRPSER